MIYHSLVSPQGSREISIGWLLPPERLAELVPGHWYAPDELVNPLAQLIAFTPHPLCIEKNVKKWWYEVQGG